MDQPTIARYQPGGDLYATIAARYGQQNADAIAAAASTGDQTQVNAAYQTAILGPNTTGSTSTAVNLYDQLTTNPLAAPVADANTVITNSASSVNSLFSSSLGALFKNPAVLLALVVGLFFFFGGSSIIRGWVKSKS